MDRWDLLIVGIAGYIAVMTLVRMMANRRDELIREAKQQVASYLKKKKKRKKSDRNAA